jgi:phosphatidylglycerophosphate synthase
MTSPSPEYRYQVEDRSILLPYYKRYVFEPILARVPPNVSPNTLSLLANAGSLFAFVVLMIARPEDQWLFLLPALGTFLYLCLDNMDGTHARRTGQSSPLGEFIDHWFDSFNTGFLTLGLYYAGRLEPEQILFVVAATNVAYFATMWEQRHTSVIHFGRGGQLEGVTVIVAVYLAMAIFGHQAIAKERMLGYLSVVELTAVLLVVGYIVTVAFAVWRTRRGFVEWLPLALVIGLVFAWYFLGALGLLPAAFILLLANSVCGGKQIISRVLGEPYSAFDPLLVGALALGFGASMAFDLPQNVQPLIGWGIALFLFARLGYEFFTTVHALRRYVRPGELLERALWMRRDSRHV